MPTKNEFVAIFLLADSGESAPAIAEVLRVSVRTVRTAWQLDSGIEAGMSNEQLVARTRWGEKTCNVGRAARIEIRANAAHGKIQARVLANKVADALGVTLNREVLRPDATEWSGFRLKGRLGQPITFTFESDPGWPWLLDMLPPLDVPPIEVVYM